MQQGVLKQPLGWLVVGTLFGAFAAVILTGFSGRFLVTVAPFVPIIYLVALTTWPLGVADPSVVQPTVPWLWYVANLVLATAVVAFSTWVSAMYVVLIPTVLFVVRLTPSGGGATVEHALLDSAYARSSARWSSSWCSCSGARPPTSIRRRMPPSSATGTPSERTPSRWSACRSTRSCTTAC